MRFYSFLLMAACLAACREETVRQTKPSDPEAKVLATIDGIPITTTDLQATLSRYQQEPFVQKRFSSSEKMKELLDNLVRYEVMALEARKRGYERDPEVQRIMQERMVKQFIKQEVTDKIKPGDIPEEKVRDYYQSHLQDFNQPEEVRISLVLIRDQDQAQKVMALVQALPKGSFKGFRDLAIQFSEDEDSKSRGGDSMFFSRKSTQLPDVVKEAAFAMKNIGEVKGPVATERGFAIIQLVERRPPGVRSLEESNVEIQTRLAETYRTQRISELVNAAKRNLPIEVNKDVLASLPDLSKPKARPDPPILPHSHAPDADLDPRRSE